MKTTNKFQNFLSNNFFYCLEEKNNFLYYKKNNIKIVLNCFENEFFAIFVKDAKLQNNLLINKKNTLKNYTFECMGKSYYVAVFANLEDAEIYLQNMFEKNKEVA
ncbi:hypothetical protein [Campylobacter sp. RM12651]|uniref:hypothetical protein n=1 Tax=Campylobacter sp. RM12651 TaxID=1660079 RepID=UPI001EFB30BD|nr:hypothetical protein [Campylobacter sp. RM12651]ULO03732.1 hypothetical protein AVBRAN_1277 [Campylobacter sp. RM12651]